MPVITTKILQAEEADPRPVTGFDYAGQPMGKNAYYNGRPEHMGPATESHKAHPGPLTKAEIRERIRAGQARARAAGKVFGIAAWRKARKAAQSDA